MYEIKNIRRGKKSQGRDKVIYAELHKNGEMVICATLHYITERLEVLTKE